MSTFLSTRLTEALGVRYPILQSPMAGGWTTPDLVVAVAAGGGFGFIPAARTTADQFAAAIAGVRAAGVDRFGVNFLLAPPEPPPEDAAAVQTVLDEIRAELGLPPGPRSLSLPPSPMPDQLEIALEARVPVVSLAMGVPGPLAGRVKDSGALLFMMVTSVEEAVEAVSLGADAVIAQGSEAGGHRATFRVGPGGAVPLVGAMALVPRIVDAVRVPVIAAGGVMDGRGLVAALALGAQGVQMGTRFLLARESGAYEAYRRRVAAGADTDTRVSNRFTGRAARGFANRVTEALEAAGVAPLPWPYQAVAAEDLYRHAVAHGRDDTMVLLAGQGPTGRIEGGGESLSASAIVQAVASEALALVEGWGAARDGD